MRHAKRKGLSMVKLRELLRMMSIDNDLSNRKIAVSIRISPSTVTKYVALIKQHDLSNDVVEDMSDSDLKELLTPDKLPTDKGRPIPDLNAIHKDLKKKHVTLSLLWEEYYEKNPDGYKRTQFCRFYQEWQKQLNPVMRQNHKAGEKLFVDYSGDTIDIQDPNTGELTPMQVFIAVMGASNYTFAEATKDQKIESWISSHIRCFEYFNAVPAVLVPDNLKSGVKHACFYDPEINPTYQALASHYDTIVLPARAYKPKDKAKVEGGVLHIQRRILAALRNQTFFSLRSLNAAIKELLKKLNHTPFQKLDGTRQQWFDEIDRPAMKPMPDNPFEMATWKNATVHIDYHIEVDKHFYSVPYKYIGKHVSVRITKSTVEVFLNNERIASHGKDNQQNAPTTLPEHMPSSHKFLSEWNPERFIKWGKKIGPFTGQIIEQVLASKPHPEQGFRSSLGILRLAKSYSEHRLERACERAHAFGIYQYGKIKSILENRLDEHPLPKQETDQPTDHVNVRGQDYYNNLN